MKAMLASMSPQEYDEWLWSLEYDPPIEEQIKTLTRLMAQLIADQRNIHRGKDTAAVSASDFLPPEPKDEEADDAESSEVSEAAAALDAHEDLRAGLGLTEQAPLLPLIPRPNAVPVDPGLFARMTGGKGDGEEG